MWNWGTRTIYLVSEAKLENDQLGEQGGQIGDVWGQRTREVGSTHWSEVGEGPDDIPPSSIVDEVDHRGGQLEVDREITVEVSTPLWIRQVELRMAWGK